MIVSLRPGSLEMASRGFFFRNRGHIRLISGSHHAFSMDCPPLAPVVALSPGRSFYAGSTHNRDGVVKSGEPASRLSRRNEAVRQSPVFRHRNGDDCRFGAGSGSSSNAASGSAPQMPPPLGRRLRPARGGKPRRIAAAAGGLSPIRPERHIPNSIATVRRRLIVALTSTLRKLQRSHHQPTFSVAC